MKTEIRECIEDIIFDSAKRAEETDGEDRAREIKNIGLMTDKLSDDYKTGEDLLDRRYKMESDEKIAHAKLRLEREKFEDEAEMKRKVKPDTKWKVGGMVGVVLIRMAWEATGHLWPKELPNPMNFMNLSKDK